MLTMHLVAQMACIALEAGADLVIEKTASPDDVVKAITSLSEPTTPGNLLDEMIVARGEWLRESNAHADALALFKDTGGNADGTAAIKMTASRESAALKKYRAAVQAWADTWRRAQTTQA